MRWYNGDKGKRKTVSLATHAASTSSSGIRSKGKSASTVLHGARKGPLTRSRGRIDYQISIDHDLIINVDQPSFGPIVGMLCRGTNVNNHSTYLSSLDTIVSHNSSPGTTSASTPTHGPCKLEWLMLMVRVQVLVWHPHGVLSCMAQEGVTDTQRQSICSGRYLSKYLPSVYMTPTMTLFNVRQNGKG